MTCHSAREVLELYVAGALAADESRRFEAHVAGCRACSAELGTYSSVVEGLGRAVPGAIPSALVRSQVLRQVARPILPASEPRSVSRPTPTFAPWLAAAALALLAVWLGYDGLRLRRQVTSLEAELGTARAQLASSESLVARLQTTADDNAHAMTVLTAPDLARVDLEGQPAAPDARARAFWSRSRGLVFSASRLPSLAAGRTYQVWVVTASAPVSVGLLSPDEAGRAQGIFVTPADIAPPVAMAVTEEPAGGVPAPTGAKYLVGLVGGKT